MDADTETLLSACAHAHEETHKDDIPDKSWCNSSGLERVSFKPGVNENAEEVKGAEAERKCLADTNCPDGNNDCVQWKIKRSNQMCDVINQKGGHCTP